MKELEGINFWNSSNEYKLDYLKNHYKSFLNTLTKRMREDGDKNVDNKVLHGFHKSQFNPNFSLKVKEDDNLEEKLQETIDFMKQVDNYWNNKLGLTFMP